MAGSDRDQRLLTLPYMVRWFSPSLLAQAAMRAAVSPVLGTFADPRATQANVDGFGKAELAAVAQRYDYSNPASMDENGAVWVDYLADTGDGFDFLLRHGLPGRSGDPYRISRRVERPS